MLTDYRREEAALALSDSHPPLSPANVYDYLANLFYARRSKINPLWNAVLVGGWDRTKKQRCVTLRRFKIQLMYAGLALAISVLSPLTPSSFDDRSPAIARPRFPPISISPGLYRSISSFLGYVDLLGTTYSSPTLATGFGSAIAQPLLREAFEAKAGTTDGTGELMTAEEAEKLLDECMKVLFYRDARSLNKVSSAEDAFLLARHSDEAENLGLVPNCDCHGAGR